MSDPIHHPAHYTAYPVQPIEISRHLGFCLGNVVKYVLRAPLKGGVEDLNKALKYLEWEAETPTMISFTAYESMTKAADRLSVHLKTEGGALGQAQALLLGQLRPYAASAFRDDAVSRDIACAAWETMQRVGKKHAGRLLDGEKYSEVLS